jgi:hypothetical protein
VPVRTRALYFLRETNGTGQDPHQAAPERRMERGVPHFHSQIRRDARRKHTMTTIVAGRYEMREPAEKAVRALVERGFHHADTTEFFVNPAGQHGSLPTGGDQFADAASSKAHVGAGVGAAAGTAAGLAAAAAVSGVGLPLAAGIVALGAFGGSFLGAMSKLGDTGDAERLEASPGRRGGEMVAVRVLNDEAERAAIEVLRAHGAQDIERREGEWRNGEWVDFDPVAPQATIDASPQSSSAARRGR